MTAPPLEHVWVVWTPAGRGLYAVPIERCAVCKVLKRIDRQNAPCRGAPPWELPAKEEVPQ